MNKRISIVCYADDAALIAESENNLQNFRYLDIDTCQAHIILRRNQINKVSIIAGCLREIVWANQYIHIRPVMMYDRETREDISKTKNMLRVTERLRSILNKTEENSEEETV
ncbi:hypothetical protein ACFW04_014308 [Cataglyphis niger]